MKKAQENWIKLAISQPGPAAALKQKALVHNAQGETVLGDVVPAALLLLFFEFFSHKELASKVEHVLCFVSLLTFDLRNVLFHSSSDRRDATVYNLD